MNVEQFRPSLLIHRPDAESEENVIWIWQEEFVRLKFPSVEQKKVLKCRKKFLSVTVTEFYKLNRESYSYLWDDVKYQQFFIAFFLPIRCHYFVKFTAQCMGFAKWNHFIAGQIHQKKISLEVYSQQFLYTYYTD
jgi:hypothetical protein